MAVFQYNAIDFEGNTVTGELSCDTARRGRDILRGRGLTVTDMAQLSKDGSTKKASEIFSPLQKYRSRISPAKVTVFIRELASLLETGVTLADGLKILSDQYSGRLSRIIRQLHDEVSSGTALSDSMESKSGCFDTLDISMVRVGQDTGELAQSLERLADFREKRQNFSDKVISALLYPAIVGVAGCGVAIFLMTVVVPNLIEILDESGKELPLATAIVKAISDFLIHWWPVVLAVPVIWAAIVIKLWHIEKVRLKLEKVIFSMPLVGELLRKQHISRMSVVLSSLLRGGLTFIDAVAVTRQTVSCRIIRRALGEYRKAVEAGSDVAAPLAESGIFPAMVVQVFAIGQQTGRLAEMLEQLAESYRKQVDTAAARLAAVLEPLIIIILAAGIGFLAFATIMPIIEVSNVL